MRGDAKVIEYLNKVLGNELVAINQYFLHAKMYQDWGFKELGAHEYHESIDEMKHADQLKFRSIIFLNLSKKKFLLFNQFFLTFFLYSALE